jgi:DNA-directed RNA polymerase subunit L
MTKEKILQSWFSLPHPIFGRIMVEIKVDNGSPLDITVELLKVLSCHALQDQPPTMIFLTKSRT